MDQSQTFAVTDTNRPPVLTAIANQSAAVLSPVTLVTALDNGTNFDADGDPLTYSCHYDLIVDGSLDSPNFDCSQLPSTAVAFNAATGAFTWTPSTAAVNTGSKPYEITISAADNQVPQLSGSRTFVVTVNGIVVTNVSSSAASGTYKAGDTVPVQLTFTQPVTVTGSPRILLDTGTASGINTAAAYAAGSGTNTLVFNYLVAAGDKAGPLDYLNTAALTLNGGTILDGQGNAAILALPAPGAAGSLSASKTLSIDGVAPTVTSVTSTTANGAYGTGAAVNIQVVFSKNVLVSGGTPTLLLATGASNATASYTGTTGGNTLNFTYTVQAGDFNPSLNYVGTTSLALGGSTITDLIGNDANLTLPPLASSNSLASTKSSVSTPLRRL